MWLNYVLYYIISSLSRRLQWATAPSFTRFLYHTKWRTTVGRIPLDEWSARRTDLYLTIHNTHNTQTSMPPVGFEPTISAGERPKTYALDRAATRTGYLFLFTCSYLFTYFKWRHVLYTISSSSIWCQPEAVQKCTAGSAAGNRLWPKVLQWHDIAAWMLQDGLFLCSFVIRRRGRRCKG